MPPYSGFLLENLSIQINISAPAILDPRTCFEWFLKTVYVSVLGVLVVAIYTTFFKLGTKVDFCNIFEDFFGPNESTSIYPTLRGGYTKTFSFWGSNEYSGGKNSLFLPVLR